MKPGDAAAAMLVSRMLNPRDLIDDRLYAKYTISLPRASRGAFAASKIRAPAGKVARRDSTDALTGGSGLLRWSAN
jgi:hypothetical protein